MNYQQIISDLNNKVYYPVYLLSGEESFYIDEISNLIEASVLEEVEKEFNQLVLYGKDVEIASLVAMAKRYPMMANHQVIIVKEAQDIKKIEDLNSYVSNPIKSTILVLCYKHKKLDKRKTFVKTIKKNGVLFESARLYDNKIPGWILSHLKSKGYSITSKAVALLSDHLGNDLSKISNEISKMLINVPINSEITPDDIERDIGISKDYNYFELQKALIDKDVLKSNKIINYFANNTKNTSIQLVIVLLYSFFSKLLIYSVIRDKSKNNVASVLSINPYFVNDYISAAKNYPQSKLRNIISILREYDLKSKGVNMPSINEGELLKEMIYKILH